MARVLRTRRSRGTYFCSTQHQRGAAEAAAGAAERVSPQASGRELAQQRSQDVALTGPAAGASLAAAETSACRPEAPHAIAVIDPLPRDRTLLLSPICCQLLPPMCRLQPGLLPTRQSALLLSVLHAALPFLCTAAPPPARASPASSTGCSSCICCCQRQGCCCRWLPATGWHSVLKKAGWHKAPQWKLPQQLPSKAAGTTRHTGTQPAGAS
jgi:hypothetical protein